MAEAAPGAVICADSDGRITHWNGAAERLFGWTAAEATGQGLELIIPQHMRAAHGAGFARRNTSDTVPFPGRVVELPALRRNGTTFAAEVALSRWREDGRLVFGASIHDISERRAAEDRLRYLAHHDPLTGLKNRGRLAELANEAAASGHTVGLVLLDLVGFKHVNDTLGHGAGDVLLADAGQRLAAATLPGDTLARLWGDKFALLSAACDTAPELDRRAHALQTGLQDPFRVGGRAVTVRATAGLALALGGGDVMADAELALAQAKIAGAGQRRALTPALRTAYLARRTLEETVCAAARAGEFVLHYQPQLRLRDQTLVGAEALMRWRHPRQGLLPPGQFMEALQDGPAAGDTGDWAIDEACRQARLWWGRRHAAARRRQPVRRAVARGRAGRHGRPRAGPPRPAARGARAGGDRDDRAAAEHGHDCAVAGAAPPGRADRAGRFRHRLRLAVHAAALPVRSLEDRPRASSPPLGTAGPIGTGPDRGNVAIIDGVLALGRGLGIAVLAEGVETAEQAAFLAARGCGRGPGLLLRPPGAAGGAQSMIRASNGGSRSGASNSITHRSGSRPTWRAT